MYNVRNSGLVHGVLKSQWQGNDVCFLIVFGEADKSVFSVLS